MTSVGNLLTCASNFEFDVKAPDADPVTVVSPALFSKLPLENGCMTVPSGKGTSTDVGL